MLSIYIHVPFCEKKCYYCNFFMIPLDKVDLREKIINNYVDSVVNEINNWSLLLPNHEIRTLHFGGGSPQILGIDNIIKIIDQIKEKFSFDFLEELGIEFNPSPFELTKDFISILNKKYYKLFRLRYSFGIQTFDDNLISKVGRDYYFNSLIGFLRELVNIKQINNVFNFDFISFGIFNKNKLGDKILWDNHKMKIFNDFVSSQFADSFSLYTLELFSGSIWNNKTENIGLFGTQDDIYEEFSILKKIIFDNNYKRYEISNFSLLGKESLHNMAYWKMYDYLGIGTGASGFIKINSEEKKSAIEKMGITIDHNIKAIRYKNSLSINDYKNGNTLDKKSVQKLSEDDYHIEQFMLGLRTNQGITNIELFNSVLVDNYKDLLSQYSNDGLVFYENNTLILTDKGMDLFNQIIVDLLKNI